MDELLEETREKSIMNFRYGFQKTLFKLTGFVKLLEESWDFAIVKVFYSVVIAHSTLLNIC